MIGNNKLVFNESTMNEIVQYYLDNVLFKKGSSLVKKVERNGHEYTFVVTIEEEKEEIEKKEK